MPPRYNKNHQRLQLCMHKEGRAATLLPRATFKDSCTVACARRKMGLQSLPVAFGVDMAKWITVATIDITQAAVAAYLFLGLKEPLYGGILTALILPQASPFLGCACMQILLSSKAVMPAGWSQLRQCSGVLAGAAKPSAWLRVWDMFGYALRLHALVA